MELLIYIGIVAVISVILTSMFVSLNWSRGNIEIKAAVNSNLRAASEKIKQDLRAATSVSTPGPGGGTSSSSLFMIISGAPVVYDVAAGRLRRTSSSGTPENITDANIEINTTDAPIVFTRYENTNSVFSPPKTTINVFFSIAARYLSDAPEQRYSAAKQTTVSLQ